MRGTKTWSITLPTELGREAEKVAKEEKRTKNDLVREAIRRYLEARQLRKLQAYGAKKARDLGISSEDDVNRLVHGYRSESGQT